MEFVNFEAIDSDQESQENFEEEDILSGNDNFIDDKSVEGDTTQPSFYRFVNQIRDLQEALNCDGQSHVDHRDFQPEMYLCEPRENVEFDNFEDSAKLSEKFKKSLRTSDDVDKEDSFFGAILFGLLTKLSNNGSFNEQPVAEILDHEFAKKLLSEK